MKIKFIKLFLLFAIFFVAPNFASAAPVITSVPTVILDEQSVSIAGSGFKTKTNAAPVYWDNFEAYTAGLAPTAGGWVVRAGTPAISTEKSYAGTQAVRFFNDSTAFQQLSRDMGTTFSDETFFKGKIYLDNTNNACDEYQWKNLRFSSSPGAYAINEEGNTAIVLMDSWYNATTTRWFNSGSPHVYYNGGLSSSTLGAPDDLFKFNQWFDFEFKLKRSSAPSAPDGSVRIDIDEVQKSIKTDFITHDADDGVYRYMLMGGSIVSCRDINDVPMNPNFKIYYDDLYVDNTQARVEICNSATWASRTHCEIQPTTAWPTAGNPTANIEVTVNQGSFANGAGAYLFVIDEDGTASAGFPIAFATSGDVTAPSAPTGLGVN
ncbi:MAG: hypothetical protein HGA36_03810 [Candidatus Moranbacteria bacterium]|nr:hypothetical protein [Candidatus Moranbacteria bacterium]